MESFCGCSSGVVVVHTFCQPLVTYSDNLPLLLAHLTRKRWFEGTARLARERPQLEDSCSEPARRAAGGSSAAASGERAGDGSGGSGDGRKSGRRGGGGVSASSLVPGFTRVDFPLFPKILSAFNKGCFAIIFFGPLYHPHLDLPVLAITFSLVCFGRLS